MPDPLRVTYQQVLAFRLAGHNLASRLPSGGVVEAAAACGIQDSPPGSAALAINARVQDLRPADVEQALDLDKTLIQVRSMRAAPHVVPTRDLAVFTRGLLPEDESSLRFFIRGAEPALDKAGISATELVERTAAALVETLDGRTLPFRELSRELTELLGRDLPPAQTATWQSPGGYAAGQSLGEALVHFALYPISLMGLYCYAPRAGNEASFVRTDQWLSAPLPELAPETARAELVRRYLRCYGPSTPKHFGEWAGIAPVAAARSWRLVEAELAEVDFAGRRTWLHADDLPALTAPAAVEGVRLLPPHDPYVGQRDRETLLPDTSLHSRLWRPVGNPGAVLAGGQLAAFWRPQKRGRRLAVTVEPFAALDGQMRSEIVDAAGHMAVFRDCTSVETVFREYC